MMYFFPISRIRTSMLVLNIYYSDKLPAPAAFAWKAMAEVLNKGFDSLPTMAPEAVFWACLVGIALPILRKLKPNWKYIPSGLAAGIAFIIPAYYSLVMVYGTLAYLVWKKKNPSSVEKFNFALASGLVAGEGLMQIVNAILALLKVPSLTG